jgi:hypothetical protein
LAQDIHTHSVNTLFGAPTVMMQASYIGALIVVLCSPHESLASSRTLKQCNQLMDEDGCNKYTFKDDIERCSWGKNSWGDFVCQEIRCQSYRTTSACSADVKALSLHMFDQVARLSKCAWNASKADGEKCKLKWCSDYKDEAECKADKDKIPSTFGDFPDAFCQWGTDHYGDQSCITGTFVPRPAFPEPSNMVEWIKSLRANATQVWARSWSRTDGATCGGSSDGQPCKIAWANEAIGILDGHCVKSKCWALLNTDHSPSVYSSSAELSAAAVASTIPQALLAVWAALTLSVHM